jgi:hypothetical protein
MNRREFLKGTAAAGAAVLPLSILPELRLRRQRLRLCLYHERWSALGPDEICSPIHPPCEPEDGEMKYCRDHKILSIRFAHEKFAFGDATGDVPITTHIYHTTKIYVEFRGGCTHQIWESPLEFDSGSAFQGNPWYGAPYLSQCRDQERDEVMDEWEATVNWAMCYFEARGNKPAEFYEMCRNSTRKLYWMDRPIYKKPPFKVRKHGLTYQRFIYNQKLDRIVLGSPAIWDEETMKRLRKHYEQT